MSGRTIWRQAGKPLANGFLIGLANIIPGVSGGTLALVLGIYGRLMTAIGGVDWRLARAALSVACFRKGAWAAFAAEWRRADLTFLALIGVGAVAAILGTSHFMSWVLRNHLAPSYAFFFGLVLVSMACPFRYLTRRSWREWTAFVLAAVLTVAITAGVSDARKLEKAEAKAARAEQRLAAEGGEEAAPSAFSLRVPSAGEAALIVAAAMLAISAMILPGISGSFVLLLLGVYFRILEAINQRELAVLGLFAAGAAIGLAVFARLMTWMMRRWLNQTLAFMIGLMAGSLYAIWPFKQVVTVGGEPVILGNVWPAAFDGECGLSLLMFAVGAALVLVFLAIDKGEPDAAAPSDAGACGGRQFE